MRTIKVTLELEPAVAAGLKRFAEKVYHSDAAAVLYAHVAKEIRDNQTSQILGGLAALESALTDAGVKSWPWVETGRAP